MGVNNGPEPYKRIHQDSQFDSQPELNETGRKPQGRLGREMAAHISTLNENWSGDLAGKYRKPRIA
jgi:hypothetical protein